MSLPFVPGPGGCEVLELGEGPIRGWEITAGPQATREKTGRGALLQALLYQQAEDVDGEWRLLSWRVPQTGRALAVELALALLWRYDLLAETYDPERDTPFARSWRAGYRLVSFSSIPGNSACALTAELRDAVSELGGEYSILEETGPDGEPRRVVLWDSGEVLAWERSPYSELCWRRCSGEVRAELDAEEAEIDAEAGRPWGAPLEEPTPDQVELIAAQLSGQLLAEEVQDHALDGQAAPACEPEGASPDGGVELEAAGGRPAPGGCSAEAALRATLALAQGEQRQDLVSEIRRLGGCEEDEVTELLGWPVRRLEQLRDQKALEYCGRVGAHAPTVLDAEGIYCGTCRSRKPAHDLPGGLSWGRPEILDTGTTPARSELEADPGDLAPGPLSARRVFAGSTGWRCGECKTAVLSGTLARELAEGVLIHETCWHDQLRELLAGGHLTASRMPSHADPNPGGYCEWNPLESRAAVEGDPFHAYAEIEVGSKEAHRLCAFCAQLEEFRRLRKRRPIRRPA